MYVCVTTLQCCGGIRAVAALLFLSMSGGQGIVLSTLCAPYLLKTWWDGVERIRKFLFVSENALEHHKQRRRVKVQLANSALPVCYFCLRVLNSTRVKVGHIDHDH